MADYLPPVVTRLEADIGEFVAKIEEAKRVLRSLGKDNRALATDVRRGFNDKPVRDMTRAVRDSKKAVAEADHSWRGLFRNFKEGFVKGGGRNQSGFFGNIMDGIQRLSGGFSKLWSNASMFQKILLSFGGGVPALIAIGIALAGIATVIAGVVGGLTAAAFGLGSFIALAAPTISGLKTNLTALSTATNNYKQASLNLDQAIKKSPADMKAYKAALSGLEPDLRSAAKLLTDQKIKWQNLTPAQQKSVDALSNNSAALKTLLPDQKNALTALMQQKAAWEALTPVQQQTARSLSRLGNTWKQMQKAIQPAVNQVINQLVKVLSNLLPYIGKFAQAAAPAIVRLLKQLATFTVSPGFQQFMKHLLSITPASITQIGKAIGHMANTIGRLITTVSKPGSIKAFGATLNVLTGTINGLVAMLGALVKAFNWVSHVVGIVVHFVERQWNTFISSSKSMINLVKNAINTGINAVVNFFKALPGRVRGAISSLPGILLAIGKNMMASMLNGLTGGLGGVLGFFTNLVGKIGSILGGIHMPHIPGLTGSAMVPAGGGAPSFRPSSGRGGAPGWAVSVGGLARSGSSSPAAAAAAIAQHLAVEVQSHVHLDGRELLSSVKDQTYKYNVKNGNRGTRGRVRGTLVPG
jgi:phage-related protein